MTSHTAQQDEAIERSLSRAGIRSRYHRQQLDRHPSQHASLLRDWVMGTSKDEPGCGWTLIGGNDTEDLAILLARGLHLTGRAMKVMAAVRFQHLLANDRAYLKAETGPTITGLLLTEAGPLSANEPAAYTPREIRAMEEWLGAWIADGRRLLIHAARPLAGGWFSAQLVQRVATVNETLREDNL